MTTRATLQTADTPQPLAVDASSLWVGQYGAVTRFDTTRTRQPVLIKGVDNVNAIAVGAGATWVSDTGNDVVSKIEGDSVVGNPIPTGAGPGALAVGNRAVWAAERFANRVARIDPSADRVVTEIPVGAAPSALAVIGHSVWVANSGDGTLSEIDTRTNHVAHTAAHRKQPRRARGDRRPAVGQRASARGERRGTARRRRARRLQGRSRLA